MMQAEIQQLCSQKACIKGHLLFIGLCNDKSLIAISLYVRDLVVQFINTLVELRLHFLSFGDQLLNDLLVANVIFS
jgi:hypothetical protein